MSSRTAISALLAAVIVGLVLAVWMVTGDPLVDLARDPGAETLDSRNDEPGAPGEHAGAPESHARGAPGPGQKKVVARPRAQAEGGQNVLDGIVTDGDGLIVAGLELVAFPVDGSFEPSFTRSDANGRFRFEGLLGEKAEIGWRSDAYLPGPRVRTETNASRLDLRVTLGAFLQGRVTDGLTGQAMGEFRVAVRPAASESRPVPPIPEEWRAGKLMRAASGSFRSKARFLHPDRKYRIEIAARARHRFTTEEFVADVAPDAEGVLADLYPPGRLGGRVVWCETRRPSHGATVTVVAKQDGRIVSRTTTETDEQGRFLLETASELPNWISVTHPDALEDVLVGKRVAGDTSGPFAVPSAQAEATDAGTFQLIPFAELSATVADASGKSVGAVLVRAVIDPMGAAELTYQFTKEALTNDKGVAHFGRVPPGRLVLSVEESENLVRTMDAVELLPRHHPNFQITLESLTCDLRGTVTTSQPVTNSVQLLVSRRLEDGRFVEMGSQEVSAPGEYAFNNLKPGLYKVEGQVKVGARTFSGSREFKLVAGNPPVNLSIRLDK